MARSAHPALMGLGAAGLLAVACLAAPRGRPALELVADVPLPGRATRFDYQSFDPTTGRLYISHMGDGRLVVFDTRANRVVADLPGFAQVTGVLFVPQQNRVYASAAGNHEVVVVDAATLRTVARISGPDFPDGIAYAPRQQRVFVSDESGGKDYVIDARTNRLVKAIPLGGEAGNTHYDPAAGHIFVAVQTKNEVAEIDPQSLDIVGRYPLPGSEHPHGFTIDPASRLMFMSCEENNRLLLVDMRDMRVTGSYPVGDGPDVLAFEPGLHRLYVASEGGTVSVFEEAGRRLRPLGEVSAPNAHTVGVDSATHRVYLPLKDLDGRPVLRIMRP